jgi:Na+-transporting NADH:ubiquinone oxidoreductase subunit NqrD
MALVKEVKELIGFGISLGERVAKSLEDGELTWTDAFQFVGVLGS